MSDEMDNGSDDSNPFDAWLSHPAMGVSTENFTNASEPANDSTTDQSWSFDPVDPSKKPPTDLNLPPSAKYGKPARQPQKLPDWFWSTLPKTRDNTPEWKKWQKAVEDWCKENHVDPGPLIDMAKDKLNEKATDDPQDDGVQPDHKDKGDPSKYDPDSDTRSGPTQYNTPPMPSSESGDSGLGDYNVPDGDTANV